MIEREWTGSFSEARNVGIEAATGDWILYLDADEVLVKEDTGRLQALKGHTWREAIYLQETNYTGNASAGTAVQHTALRLFRNRPDTGSRAGSTSSSPTRSRANCQSALPKAPFELSITATSELSAKRRTSHDATWRSSRRK